MCHGKIKNKKNKPEWMLNKPKHNSAQPYKREKNRVNRNDYADDEI